MVSVQRIATVIALALVGVLMLGCSPLGGGPDAAPVHVIPTPPAVSKAQLAEVLASYDRRNNAAIRATRKAHDPSAWLTADVGPVLRVDAFDTRHDLVTGGKGELPVLTHAGTAVYSPAVTAGEQSILVDLTRRSTLKSDKPDRVLTVFRRDDSSTDWRLGGLAELSSKAVLPTPFRFAAPALTAAERKSVAAWGERVRRDLEQSKDSGLGLAMQRSKLRVSGAAPFLAFLKVTYPLPVKDQFGPQGGLVAVRAEEGIVAVVMLVSQATYRGPLSWDDQDYARTVAQVGEQEEVTKRVVIGVALHLVGEKATLLGTSLDDAL